jgi:rare lipoprotein A
MSKISRARTARAIRVLILTVSVCALFPSVFGIAGEPMRQPAACSVPPPSAGPRHTIGNASWYGSQFANRPTASGELFDPEKLTAAHRKLPLGTKVVVTNLHNGRSVLVTITDRGPDWDNRDIDLTYRAARVLGLIRRGVARVRIQPL